MITKCRQPSSDRQQLELDTNVRLGDVDSAELQVRAEVVAREEPFSQGDRSRDQLREVRDLFGLRGQQGLCRWSTIVYQ